MANKFIDKYATPKNRNSHRDNINFIVAYQDMFGTTPTREDIDIFRNGRPPDVGDLSDTSFRESELNWADTYGQQVVDPRNDPYRYQEKTYKTAEDYLSGLSPYQVYEARFKDYLPQMYERIDQRISDIDEYWTKEIDDINNMFRLGQISEELAQSKVNDINNRYSQEMDYLDNFRKNIESDVMEMISRQAPLEEMPYYRDVSQFMGAETNKLLNQQLAAERESQRQQGLIQQNQPAYNPEGQQIYRPELFPGVPRETAAAYAEQGAINRQEMGKSVNQQQADYITLVNNLNVIPEFKDYYYGRFDYYYNLWLQTDRAEPFIRWVSRKLLR